jgi:hypothetical protein
MTNINKEEASLRAEVSALAAVKTQRRYGADLRRRIAQYARARAGRMSIAAIAASIGVSEPTLAAIVAGSVKPAPRPRRRRERAATPPFVRVAAKPDRPRAALMVRGPGGIVIEGLSIEEAALLLGRLTACSG